MRSSHGYMLLLALGLILTRVLASEDLPTMVSTISVMTLEYQLGAGVELKQAVIQAAAAPLMGKFIAQCAIPIRRVAEQVRAVAGSATRGTQAVLNRAYRLYF